MPLLRFRTGGWTTLTVLLVVVLAPLLVLGFPMLALTLGVKFLAVGRVDFLQLALVVCKAVNDEEAAPGVARGGESLPETLNDLGNTVEVFGGAEGDLEVAGRPAEVFLPRAPVFAEKRVEAAGDFTDEPDVLGAAPLPVFAPVAGLAAAVAFDVAPALAPAEFQRGQRTRRVDGELVAPRREHRVDGAEFGRDEVRDFEFDFMQPRRLHQGREVRRLFAANDEAAELGHFREAGECGIVATAELHVGELLEFGEGREVVGVAEDFEVEEFGVALEAVEFVRVLEVEAAQFGHSRQVGQGAEGDIEAVAVAEVQLADLGQAGNAAEGEDVAKKPEVAKLDEAFQPAQSRPGGTEPEVQSPETGELADDAQVARDAVPDVQLGECGVGEQRRCSWGPRP